MKIFVSWSGELSKRIAEELKKWIPCVLQSVEVFFSPEDIEKGQNWNSRITEELAQCNYGIVCLTAENRNAGWVNFEAGAIAKALDSRMTALLVDVAPSDVQGPLSLFQATKIEKEDFFKLLTSINNCLEPAIDVDALKTLYDAVWEKMKPEFESIVAQKTVSANIEEKKENDMSVLEDILQHIREQSRLLSDPQNLLPKKYLRDVLSGVGQSGVDKEDLSQYADSIVSSLDRLIEILNEMEEDAMIEDEIWKEIECMLNDTKVMLKRQDILDYYRGEKANTRIRSLLNEIPL